MKTNKQSGFTAIEGIFAVLAVVVIAAAGYFAYQNYHKTSASTPTSKPQDGYVNVIQSDNSLNQVTPEQIAKTTDQANILRALHDSCSGEPNHNVTVKSLVFDGRSDFIQDGTHAYIIAGVCDEVTNYLLASNYLHKNNSGTWILDASINGYLPCNQVDGLGYPADVIPACYVTSPDNQRAPK
jgi:hypothetical protein